MYIKPPFQSLDLSVLFVTSHLERPQTSPDEKEKAINQPVMIAAPAFKVNAPLFVDRKEGCLRKRLNRHVFGYCILQLCDDDILFSTGLFNATPHVLVHVPPQVEKMKKLC